MTLIATHIGPAGIILASDSNLSTSSGALAGQAQKTYPIDHLSGGLSFAGSFAVNGVSVDQWMPDFIRRSEAQGTDTLESVSRRLASDLQQSMANRAPDMMMIHIAGHVTDRRGSHPEFWFVRNLHHIQADGSYSDADPVFLCSEDFHNRDYPNIPQLNRDTNNWEQYYFNGYPSGRIGYMAARHYLQPFFEGLWSQPQLGFRPPSSLTEFEAFVRLQMGVIHELFASSGKTVVGGDIQTLAIAPP